MVEEESEWRDSQPACELVPSDDHIVGRVDNDFIPGCYVLNIGIEDLFPQRLWIRADYIRMYNYFQPYYDSANPRDRAPSAVLTGQQGIGKSLWTFYAARRRAAERKPFIWHYTGCYVLFVNEGVYLLPENIRHDMFSQIVWAFIDADAHELPPCLIAQGMQLFVIFISYPIVSKWTKMEKTTRQTIVVMNPWGRGEIKCLLPLLIDKGITEAHVSKVFNQLGPIPRLCTEAWQHQLERYKFLLNWDIINCTMSQFQKLTTGGYGFHNLHEISERLCLLSRQHLDNVGSLPVTTSITPWIESRL